MKYYDGKKIREYIQSHLDGLVSVSVGMTEDRYWTTKEIWANGAYLRGGLDKKYVEVAGINGSYWATPTLFAIFADGHEESAPVYWEDTKEASPGDVQRMKKFARATDPTWGE